MYKFRANEPIALVLASIYDYAPYETTAPTVDGVRDGRRLEICTRGRGRSTARRTLGQKCARRGFTTPRHIMSSGALEPKKSGDFYWSKDEVRRASRLGSPTSACASDGVAE